MSSVAADAAGPGEMVSAALAGAVAVATVPIPLDCTEGFNEAYYVTSTP